MGMGSDSRPFSYLPILAACGWLGCEAAGTPVIVDVSPLPPEAVSVQLLARLGQTIAPESPSLDRVPGKQDFSFSFHLPAGAAGKAVAVGAAAKDRQGCLLAIGDSAETPATDALLQLPVPLDPLTAPDCSDRMPRSCA